MALSKKSQNELCNAYKKDKLSVGQIAKKFSIPASTITSYLDKNNIKRRSRSEAVTHWHITEFGKKPFVLKKNLSPKEKALKLAGVMLYWAEGAKGGASVKFVNSDPAMVKIFLDFLRSVCCIHEERLKLLIHRYPDQNEEALRTFWSKITEVSESNFYRSYVHVGKVGTYKNKSLYGTIAVNYSDKKLLEVINNWIAEYKQSF